MKGFLKRTLAIIMTVVMLCGIAPLNGFVGLELPDWLNFDWLDFSTKSEALAASGKCGDNVTYTFDSSTGLLTISGTGAMNYGCPFYNNSSIKTVVIESCVTSIGDSAFYGCTGLTSVTIGNSVTSIGNYAFYGCTGLTSVTLPDSVTSIEDGAFKGCTGLTSVTIPDSVTSIGSSAFSGCTGLTSIAIPDSVTSIGSSAFSGCTGLTSITIPDSVTSIGDYAFKGCTGLTSVTIGNNVTYIGVHAFEGCTGLTSVTIGNSVTSIGSSAFYGCTGLTSVTLPDSVTSIGGSAFYVCTGLTRVNISSINSWVNIYFGNYFSNPLYYAHNLYLNGELVTDITIPGSVTSIGSSAFYNCTVLTNVTIPDSVTCIGNYAFYGCTGLTSVTIPDSVTSIGGCAFYGCTGLTSVTIGNSVTSIDDYAFSGCTGLTSVTIGNSVKSIGRYAFSDCTGLTSVTIGNSVTSIGSYAFSGCTGLKTIICYQGSYAETYASNNNYNCFYILSDGENAVVTEQVTSKLNYTLNKAIRTLTIYCSGVMPSFQSQDPPWNQYDHYIEHIIISEGCTKISVNAFKDLWMQSVTIPLTVTAIDANAFSNCSGLNRFNYMGDASGWMNITFADDYSRPNMYARELYFNNLPVTNLVIPDGVTSISSYAFNNFKNITSVTIPDSVTSIDDYAFYGCTGLTSVTIPDSVTSIGNSAFSYCTGLTSVTIPDSVTSIGSSAFENCPLEYVNMGDGLTSIPSSLINRNTLKTFIIGNNVTSIGSSAFSGCTGLTSVTIPDSVTSIGDYAFKGCTGLTSITIPDSVTSIGNYAFYGCTGLKELTMPCSAKIYNSQNTFGGCANIEHVTLTAGTGAMQNYYGTSTATYYQYTPWYISRNSIESITLEDGITNIGNYAFNGCIGLTSVTIPDSVTSIEYGAFLGCTGLTSITIGNNVTDIGDGAFSGCTGLTSITIPDSVTNIGDNAFNGCTSLEDVVLSISVQSIGVSSFPNVKTIKFYNRNCTIGTNAVSYIATIYGYAGSTAEAFADENGFNFVEIDENDHEHVYSYPCDAFCNICGYERTDVTHTFSNPCDPECDICGYVRSEITHTYDNDCDDTCNVCGEKRTPPHNDQDNNGICDLCGLTLSDITPGNTASIKVSAGETGYLKFIPTQKGVYRFYSTGSADTYGYICDSNKSAIASDNDSGNNNNFSVSATLTAGTVYYLGARYYNSSSSGTISVTLVCDQVICDHVTTHEEHQDPTCTVNGYTRVICDVCGQTVSETVYPASHHYAWVTVRNATTTEEGLAQKKCTVCGFVADEFAIPVMVADFVTGITLSPKTIALNVGETADITAVITPDTATNKAVIWSSTYSENVTVENGTITAILPGTSVIIAETEDGGYRDFCHVRVIGVTPSNGAVIDSESGLIYGLSPKLNSVESFVNPLDETITVTCSDDVIGTGSVIQIVAGGETIDAYKAVIFGDVNSDGIYDGQDALIVNCIANGMLTREQVGEAKYLAADCNHDGEVNASDVLLLEQAGLLLANVDQTASQDELMQSDSYMEYLNLIDQNPAGGEPIPEEPAEPDPAPQTFLAKLIEILQKVITFIRSLFPKI